MTLSHLFRQDVVDSPGYGVAHVENAIKLNQNESPWDLPIELKVAITEKLIKTDFNRYPLADPLVLKKKLAKTLHVMADQIALANGSNVLIQALVNATSFRNKGKVLVLDPSFAVYSMQAELFGCQVIRVPLGENFLLSHDAVIAAIKKENPTLIFIANPNAPTGNLFAKESLYKIVKAAQCLTVIDEAYYPYSNETLIDWLSEFQHLLILRTLSKAFALAGVRFGYAIADTEIIFQIEKVLLPFCLSSIACAIAGEALDHSGYVKDYTKIVLKERRKLFDELQKFKTLTAFPSDANFILFRVEDSIRVAKELKHRNVLVRDVGDGKRLKNCLRVSVGTPEENRTFLLALREVVA